MPMVRAMRLLNAIEAGTTSGAQLQTLLTADPGRLAELNVLLGMRGQNQRLFASATATAALIASPAALNALVTSKAGSKNMAANPDAMAAVAASSTAMAAVIASSTAMTAVAASSTAMAAVAASSTAMTAVIASSTAMAAVAASSTAMAAVAASSTAKMAIFNSDVALNAVAASSTALITLRAAGTYSVISKVAGSGAQTIPGPTAGQSYILLGVSSSDAGTSQTITSIATRRADSARPVTASTGAAMAATAQTVTLCTPLVSPFTFTTNNTVGYVWYFGLLRCDV